MEFRGYESGDAEATLTIFLRAVRETAPVHHTPAQISAWADEAGDLASWGAARAAAQTLVCTVEGRVVGFVDLDDDAHVDMLFVDPDVGRQGIASALLVETVAAARRRGLAHVTTFASLTSEPVFARQGFVVTGHRILGEGDGAVTTSEMRLALPVDEADERSRRPPLATATTGIP